MNGLPENLVTWKTNTVAENEVPKNWMIGYSLIYVYLVLHY